VTNFGRLGILAALALMALALAGCPAAEETSVRTEPARDSQAHRGPAGILGYYVLDDPAAYMAKSMADVPPGQVRHLGIERGRWMLRDMLVGFGGSWIQTPTGAKLTITEGPSGPLKGNESLEAVRTETGLILRAPQPNGEDMVFTYVGESLPKDFGMDDFLGPKK
jgi:hypothetical protein